MRHFIFFGKTNEALDFFSDERTRHFISSEEIMRHFIFYCCNNIGKIILLDISSEKIKNLAIFLIFLLKNYEVPHYVFEKRLIFLKK
jgi:hypothetical protein